jgi:hypothetical protein
MTGGPHQGRRRRHKRPRAAHVGTRGGGWAALPHQAGPRSLAGRPKGGRGARGSWLGRRGTGPGGHQVGREGHRPDGPRERGERASSCGWAARTGWALGGELGRAERREGGFSLYPFSYLALTSLQRYFSRITQPQARKSWSGMMQQPRKIFLGFTYTRYRAKSR